MLASAHKDHSIPLILVSGFLFSVFGFRFPIPDSRFRIPDSRFPIPDSRFPIPDFRFRITNSGFPIPDSRSAIPDPRFQISDSGCQFLGFICISVNKAGISLLFYTCLPIAIFNSLEFFSAFMCLLSSFIVSKFTAIC